MSGETKERAGSLVLSAFGAWLGLGSGLFLLVFSLLAVSFLVVRGDKSDSPPVLLHRALGTDLNSVVPADVALVDGVLRLQVTREGTTKKEVVYSFSKAGLTRTEEGGESSLVAELDGIGFRLEENRLYADWSHDNVSGREVWALNR